MVLLFLQAWMALSVAAHPFFVSVTEVNHNAAEKTMEVSCKVFFDDMEAVLKQNYKTVADLSKPEQQKQNDQLLAHYLARHLSVTVNGKAIALKYLGYEKESESVFCYLEGSGVNAVQSVDIKTDLLHDFTPQQINIVHCIVGGRRQSTKLDFPNKQASFKY